MRFILGLFILVQCSQQQPCSLRDRNCRNNMRVTSATWDAEARCDTVREGCRQKVSSRNGEAEFKSSKCVYDDMWLIPGNADATCGKPTSNKHVKIDVSTVEVIPKVLKLPGCFTIRFVVEILPSAINNFPSSFFGRADYKWLNLQEFSDLTCQNSLNNGCGGYGNGCYYCDVCDQLKEIDGINGDSKDQSRVVDQFKGLKCPSTPGLYQLEKKFCFNDYSAFDTDGNCKIDALERAGMELGEYKSAFETLDQLGFGTVVSTFYLAHNATKPQENKKITKEREIEKIWSENIDQNKENWDNQNGRFEKFKAWHIQYQKDIWHRNKYLPWLIYTNEVACLSVSFDVCNKKPTDGGSSNNGRVPGWLSPQHKCPTGN